jgi:GTP-binding protein
VELDNYETMVWADIPGLIEGAASGTGLGHDFLRHVERTRVLIHLLDGSASDPLEDWAMINQELTLYDTRLESKPQLVVLNKMDLVDGIAWEPLIREKVSEAGFDFCAISAVTNENVREMIYRVKKMLDESPEPKPIADNEMVIIRPEPDESIFTVETEEDGWRVRGKRIERIAAMTYWEFEATTRRFQQILDSMGISKALNTAGVQPGDTVHIGDEVLEWSE